MCQLILSLEQGLLRLKARSYLLHDSRKPDDRQALADRVCACTPKEPANEQGHFQQARTLASQAIAL